jgi:hypothetical protein
MGVARATFRSKRRFIATPRLPPCPHHPSQLKSPASSPVLLLIRVHVQDHPYSCSYAKDVSSISRTCYLLRIIICVSSYAAFCFFP